MGARLRALNAPRRFPPARNDRLRADVEEVLLRVFGRQKLTEMREAEKREFFGFCGMKCYRDPEA